MVNMVAGANSATGQFLRDRVRQARILSFPDRASVYRIHTQSTTSDFGHATTWFVTGNYPAKYWTISGQEALVLGQLAVEGGSTLVLPYNADITEKDQVIYHFKETGVDAHLEVTAVHRASQNQNVHVSCIELKFIQPDMPVG